MDKLAGSQSNSVKVGLVDLPTSTLSPDLRRRVEIVQTKITLAKTAAQWAAAQSELDALKPEILAESAALSLIKSALSEPLKVKR
jgi:hypothetical protein